MKRTAILIISLGICLLLAVPAMGRIPGDVDGDGAITPADARLALRTSVLLETPDETARTAADFDGDGETDMLCGQEDGTLVLVPHTRLVTGNGTLNTRFADIDVGECSTPQCFDLDGDGNNDLIIGNRRGLLSYYRNVSGDIAEFQKITDTLGGVDMRDFTQSYFGYSVPCLYRDAQQGTVLFCAGELGEVAYYKQIDGNLDGVFEKAEANLAETIDGMAQPFREGRRVAAVVADLNGDDRPDMLLGNYAGGVTYFHGSAPVPHSAVPHRERFEIVVRPNPTNGKVVLDGLPSGFHTVEIFDFQGRKIAESNLTECDLSSCPAGLYFLRVHFRDREDVVLKVVRF